MGPTLSLRQSKCSRAIVIKSGVDTWPNPCQWTNKKPRLLVKWDPPSLEGTITPFYPPLMHNVRLAACHHQLPVIISVNKTEEAEPLTSKWGKIKSQNHKPDPGHWEFWIIFSCGGTTPELARPMRQEILSLDVDTLNGLKRVEGVLM